MKRIELPAAINADHHGFPGRPACAARPAGFFLPDFTDTARRPNRSRLRRVVHDGLRIEGSDLIANIAVLQHGGHVRPVITRGGRHQRQRLVSRKMGATQVSEGRGEELLAMYNEVQGRIPYYKCHPFLITAAGVGRTFGYRPDAIRQWRDGTIELIEVKRTVDDLRDPDLREKLGIIAEFARLCGWVFRILYLADISGPGPRTANVEALYGRRTMKLTSEEATLAAAISRKGKPTTWGELRRILCASDPLHGDALIECLSARGQLLVDLDERFTTATVVQPVMPFAGPCEIDL